MLWGYLAPSRHTGASGEAQTWREGLLAALLLVGLALGLVVMAVAALTLVQEGAWWLMALNAGVYLFVAALYFLPGLSYFTRALSACLVLYVVGLAVTAQLGPFSGGPAYLFTFCVLAGVLLGVRWAIVSLGLNVAAMLALAFMLSRGHFPEVLAVLDSPGRWLSAGFSFVFLNVVAAISVALLVKGLQRSLEKEAASRAELELEMARRSDVESDLAEREKWYRTTFEHTGTAMVVIAQDTTIHMSNQKFAEMCGVSSEELIGRSWRDFVHPEDLARMADYHRQRRSGGRVPTQYEFRFLDHRGNQRLVENTVQVIPGTGYSVASLMDITERQRQAQGLAESEERARATLEASPDPMVVYDIQGRVNYFNPAFTRVFGWELAELKGRRAPFVPDSEKDLTARMVQRCLEQTEPVSFTSRRLTRQGKELDILLSASRTVDSGGETSGMVVNLTDITERRDMERALEESEKRYRDLVDNITDFVYTHDLKGRFTSINRAACNTLGYRTDEVVGRPIPDIMMPEHAEEFYSQYLKEVKEQGSATGLSIYLDAKGGHRYLEYRNELVREEGSEPFVRGSAREVTERIMGEREQRNLEEQLFQAQKMEALGTLTGGVAHDVTNILSAILGSLDLAADKLAPDHPSRRHLTSAVNAANRAVRVTRQLLTTARRAEPLVGPVSVERVIGDTMELMAETIDRRIQVRAEVAPDLHWVRGDEAQISQVIMNLAVNARDAVLAAMSGEEGGDAEHRITVAARNVAIGPHDKRASVLAYAGEFVEIEVADTGCGMDQDTLERAYEPFFTTKPASEGTGLGLATVYGIVDQHQGWLEASSQPGQGASFKVLLPAVRPGDEDALAEPALAKAPQGEECILVVDDEVQILDVTQEALTGLGYRVITARDGQEALAQYHRHQDEIDLLILDLTMPKLSGREVARRVLETTPQARIIISSGNILAGDEEMGKEPEARLSYLHKPYNLHQLAMAVRERLGD